METTIPRAARQVIGCIISHYRFPHLQFAEADSVADILAGRTWRIPSHLPSELKDELSHSTSLLSSVSNLGSDTLTWPGNSTGVFSISAAWDSLRTKAATTSWSKLVWNKCINPRLACMSWRLMHRRTPTDSWAKSIGCSLASRCHLCFLEEESESHLFFSCILSSSFWQWLTTPCGAIAPPSLSVGTLWSSLLTAGDGNGRKCAAAIFFHAISALWLLRNDSKHHSRKPSLDRVKGIFLSNLQGMALSVQDLYPHPILLAFGIIT